VELTVLFLTKVRVVVVRAQSVKQHCILTRIRPSLLAEVPHQPITTVLLLVLVNHLLLVAATAASTEQAETAAQVVVVVLVSVMAVQAHLA
jgi:hypothetical protein